MVNNLVTTESSNMLAFAFGLTNTVPTLPITLGLDTVVGNATTAGTPVAGGSYAPQTFTASGATAEQVSNANAINFTNMPAVASPGVQGITIRDSATTPARKWSGPLAAAKITNAGDTLSFAVGAVVASLV